MDKPLGALLLILWLQLDWVQSQKKGDQQQVKQTPSLSVQEGKISILSCDYDNDLFDYFSWYQKSPAKGPEFLISIRSFMDENEDGRFAVFLNKSAKRLSLHIAGPQSGDSALYLCAASAQCSLGTYSLYPNLQLGPCLFGVSTGRHVLASIYTQQ